MHLCRNLRVIGAHVDGGFAEYVVIPETNAIESNGLDPAIVALQEPMGNAVHAAFVEPIEGKSVAITGCGRIGLLGIFPEPVSVDLSDMVIQRGIRLYGIYGRRIYDSWERTQALLRSGRFDPTPILTHRFDLADWERGFELIASRHAGKV